MYAFLERYYDETKSDDVGALLGSMSLLPDGGTADPDVWQDWLESVKKAKEHAVDLSLSLRK